MDNEKQIIVLEEKISMLEERVASLEKKENSMKKILDVNVLENSKKFARLANGKNFFYSALGYSVFLILTELLILKESQPIYVGISSVFLIISCSFLIFFMLIGLIDLVIIIRRFIHEKRINNSKK